MPEANHANTTDAEQAAAVRVFITYSHETDEHKRRVLGLAQQLRHQGLDVRLDQFQAEPVEGWQRWSREEHQAATFVLAVCTPEYRRRFEGSGEPGKGQGTRWEGYLTELEMYRDDMRNLRFIPVLFDEGDEDAWRHAVPLALQASTRFRLPSQYPALYDRLTGKSGPTPAPFGSVRLGVTRYDANADPELVMLRDELRRLKIEGAASEQIKSVNQRILVRRRQLRALSDLGKGTRLCDARFELVEHVGQGGFGAVWKAYDRQAEQLVAVKVLHMQYRDDRSVCERFFRGARHMASLDHPGIVKVILAQGRPAEPPYFVMEYLVAGDLQRSVRTGQWPKERSVAMLIAVAEALAHAHANGKIHRDVKPANILLGRNDALKLTDFDLVHAADTTGGTRTGAVGTFVYAAPEALEDGSRVDQRTDIYSLGMVGVFAVHGRELPMTVVRDARRVIAQLDCSETLKAILSRACSWERDDRYARVEELLVELRRCTEAIGGAAATSDSQAITDAYVRALEQDPANREILSKLLGIYSDASDWPNLIEIILRIAKMVDAPDQLAKYYTTAARIAHVELDRFDEAANYYESALEHLPPEQGRTQFEQLVKCLTANMDWERLEQVYERRLERLRQAGTEPVELAKLLDARAAMLSEHLGRGVNAVELWEQAQRYQPDNLERKAKLEFAYAKEPKRYFASAIALHRSYLAEDPYRVASIMTMRRVYVSNRKPDEAWCLCQALSFVQSADLEEENFFKKYRLLSLPRAKRTFDEELYRLFVMHPIQDRNLTSLFAALEPAIVATHGQPLNALGVDPQLKIDVADDSSRAARMLVYAAELTGIALPPTYRRPQDQRSISFLFAVPPAIGLGVDEHAAATQKTLAFKVAHHVSFYRRGSFVRQLMPAAMGLRSWIFAALRLVAPNFPLADQLESSVQERMQALRSQLNAPQRDALRRITLELLEAQPELDINRWIHGVDLSADRLGFVLANDLSAASAAIEDSPEADSSVSVKDRLRELFAYSVSEEYFRLRSALGIALGG